MSEKAIIAMSGGVDSSVAAYLMKSAGFACAGVTMKLFDNENVGASDKTCCTLDDAEDARSVAVALGIPHYVFNFSEQFEDDVIKRFVRAYENGRTPNPCIDCNCYLKFDKLLCRAAELGYEYVATGHYARVEKDGASGRFLLKKAVDPAKDQSYVLYTLNQEQLSRIRFPLGELTKAEVREIAEKQGFVNARKRESQDICFVPNGDYAAFIERYTGKKYPCGEFKDRAGNILGTHNGVIRYTLGQRRGLGISAPEPLYVCAIDPRENIVTIGGNADLYTRVLTARDINLVSVERIDRSVRLKAKTRYRQAEQWATVVQTDDNTLRVEFNEPQRAVTPGQAVVLYDGDIVVGGGVIEKTE